MITCPKGKVFLFHLLFLSSCVSPAPPTLTPIPGDAALFLGFVVDRLCLFQFASFQNFSFSRKVELLIL